MFKLLITLTIVLSSSVFASEAEMTPRQSVARCVQDIADYKHGLNEGLKVAAGIMDRLLAAHEDVSQLDKECRHFLATTSKYKISRKSQLEGLAQLKSSMDLHSYFFIRSAIRPLIVCEKGRTRLYRTCRSTTGKSWYETGFHPRSASPFLYRLGHSETPGGILVLGPQDEVTSEDLEFISSLPAEFTRQAEREIGIELETRSYRMKVFMLPRTTYFIDHFIK